MQPSTPPVPLNEAGDEAGNGLQRPARTARRRAGCTAPWRSPAAVQSFFSALALAAVSAPKDSRLEVTGPARKVSPESLSDHWNHGESPDRCPVDTGKRIRSLPIGTRLSA